MPILKKSPVKKWKRRSTAYANGRVRRHESHSTMLLSNENPAQAIR
jgi:hypothetical protein